MVTRVELRHARRAIGFHLKKHELRALLPHTLLPRALWQERQSGQARVLSQALISRCGLAAHSRLTTDSRLSAAAVGLLRAPLELPQPPAAKGDAWDAFEAVALEGEHKELRQADEGVWKAREAIGGGVQLTKRPAGEAS